MGKALSKLKEQSDHLKVFATTLATCSIYLPDNRAGAPLIFFLLLIPNACSKRNF